MKEINDQYVSHAIWFPEQFKITGKDDKSVWCLQWKIAEVFTIVFIENLQKLSKSIAFSLVVVLTLCIFFSVTILATCLMKHTIHILSHHCGQSPKGIHKDFMEWIPHNMQWVRQASGFILKKKKLDLVLYLRYLINENFKFDEIALLLYARMYQIHVGIILNNKYWSTHRQQTMENFQTSDIVLAYTGNLHFLDTVKHQITVDNIEVPPHLLFSMNMSFLTSWSGKG